ncbi:hypothetical protein [Streptomyces sp. Ag109_G2-15]|uniref:hypothetical protein n=1 Tax=Streptomyces sp. Ag109_G2-15 TaxID=1938850 RepID=UPI000BD44B43|nr:hypothetical protein [Streptomyces sp. Ag109_G2-15]SOD80923.1 Mce-associated membrane protein [Streptomyces sp. Ag109_G2-15]
MANPTTRTRGTGSPARRTLTAAARAAAKRARLPEHDETTHRAEERLSGHTVVIEPPGGWDDPPEPAPEPDADEQESAPARPPRLPRVLTAALCLALVAALTAAAVLGWQYRQGQQTARARTEALAAARKAAPVVLSYDYRHLDRDFARARALLTGAFRDQYGRTTKTVVGPTAKKYHGVVKATVAAPTDGGAPAVSVVSAAPDRAVVLLFVNQITQSTQVSGARLDLNRVRMTLARTADGWKVSAVDAL